MPASRNHGFAEQEQELENTIARLGADRRIDSIPVSPPDGSNHDASTLPFAQPPPLIFPKRCALAKCDLPSGASAPAQGAPTQLAPTSGGASTPTAPAPGASQSGTIPDVRTPPGGQWAPPSSGPLTPGVGRDTVTSNITLGSFSQPSAGGRVVTPWGDEFFEPALSGIKYALANDKCAIAATLDVMCPWGTTLPPVPVEDVPSPTAPVVTVAAYKAIEKDLRPSTTSPFKSPRHHYYSQSLIERHEKFHGTDDFDWVKSAGLGVVKRIFETYSVRPDQVDADVKLLAAFALALCCDDARKYYAGSGKTHDDYAGEIRAYADGRPLYTALADGVAARGKALGAAPTPGPGGSAPAPAPSGPASVPSGSTP